MIKTLITPEEISTLARPCYADEEKSLAYIVEAEQNNIKPAIGDDLYIQLKEGGQTFLLEGGIYERNGKRYYLNGIKKALAYFVISRLYESSTTELTRQGVVNRRSEYSDNADNSEIISVSRETYAIANRYMEEVEKYLGTDVKNTSQRVRFDLVGGGSNVSRQCRPSSSSSGGASPSSPSANINVVHVLGNSDKDVISQAGVTREFNAIRDEIKGIEVPTLPTLAKVAETGDYNDLKNTPTIPSIDGLASTTEVDEALNSAKSYTDEKFTSIDIPTKTSQLENDSNFAEGMDIITIDEWTDGDNLSVHEESYLIGIYDNQRLIVTAIIDKNIVIMPIMDGTTKTATMEIIFSTIENVPEILFPDEIMWAKEPVLNSNKVYAITIEGNNVDGAISYLAMYAEFDYLNTEE